jgi:hypothetical protein
MTGEISQIKEMTGEISPFVEMTGEISQIKEMTGEISPFVEMTRRDFFAGAGLQPAP